MSNSSFRKKEENLLYWENTSFSMSAFKSVNHLIELYDQLQVCGPGLLSKQYLNQFSKINGKNCFYALTEKLCCYVSVDQHLEMLFRVIEDKRNDTDATSNDQATIKGVKCLIFQYLFKQVFNTCLIATWN